MRCKPTWSITVALATILCQETEGFLHIIRPKTIEPFRMPKKTSRSNQLTMGTAITVDEREGTRVESKATCSDKEVVDEIIKRR